MKPLTPEWIEKAEGDHATAEREMRARRSPNFDSACFHSQQCAEKYLKAILQENSISIPKTHDMLVLLDLILPIDPIWETYRSGLSELTEYAVQFRYPGESATKEQAVRALKLCRIIRKQARDTLGLK
jgi:HEPN domain-containing protein